jgi:hypothetical protein
MFSFKQNVCSPSKTVGGFTYSYVEILIKACVDGDYPDIFLNSGPRRNGLIINVIRDRKYRNYPVEPGVKANGYQS